MVDLVTLDCYKEYKNIKSTERDGRIQTLIEQVSALVENYCNRKFVEYSSSPGVTEWFDAKTNEVFLTNFPIIAIGSVNVSEDGGVTQDALTEASANKDGYFVDLLKGILTTQKMIDNFLTTYDTPYRSLEVNYTAGYTEDTIPEDLKLCVMDLVTYYEQGESVPTQSLLGGTIDNPQPYLANSFPPHIRRILDLYRCIS